QRGRALHPNRKRRTRLARHARRGGRQRQRRERDGGDQRDDRREHDGALPQRADRTSTLPTRCRLDHDCLRPLEPAHKRLALFDALLAAHTFVPSKAMPAGFVPAIQVETNAPVAATSSVTSLLPKLATQMFAPSNVSALGAIPTVNSSWAAPATATLITV